MKILLMGNPNVGKSVIFSRLTGIEVVSANYPGTTVEYTEGRMKLGEQMATLVDAPGVYSLDPTSHVEEVTRQIFAQGADVIVNVIDSTNLERNLNLTLQILEWGLPTVVALNLWDVATHKGIEIDTLCPGKRAGRLCGSHGGRERPGHLRAGGGHSGRKGAAASAALRVLRPALGAHRRDCREDPEGPAQTSIHLRQAGGHLHQAADRHSHCLAGALSILQPGDSRWESSCS